MSAIDLACLPPAKVRAFHGGSLDGRRSASESGLPASGKEISTSGSVAHRTWDGCDRPHVSSPNRRPPVKNG